MFGRAKIGIFKKMRMKNLEGGQRGPIYKNSTPSPWKRRKITSSATFCATGAWGLKMTGISRFINNSPAIYWILLIP